MSDSEQDEHVAVIESAEPLSRASLHDGEVVAALWREVEVRDVANIPLNAHRVILQDCDTDGNIFLRDVRTALHAHGLKETSDPDNRDAAFEHEIYESQ